jgi:pimeloyl-ACP methyl ester carboxylesterase
MPIIPSRVKKMVLHINGIDLYWEEFGMGEPLLWLHGGMGSGRDWEYLFHEPPAGYRLIAPDLRGHGASTNPSGVFTFRQAAQDVIALMHHLHLPQFKAIGLSGGGITLLHLATMEPDAILSMVLVSAPPYFPAQARSIMKTFSEESLSPDELQRMRARHKRGEEQIRMLFAATRGFANSYDDVNFTPPFLSTIRAETLIVFGDRDPLYPVSLALDLKQSIPNSYLWVVPNGGHGPIFGPMREPFAASALEFLKDGWRTAAL